MKKFCIELWKEINCICILTVVMLINKEPEQVVSSRKEC